ncbi:hypothetical protein U3516DRAFT_886274, partial [Neocallimastix sp. 'constans']
SNSKDIECLYFPAMENFHKCLKTFLDKAIRDSEDSVYNYNTVRIEMDITTQMIAQTKQRLNTEINDRQEYRPVTLILREHEQFYKIKKDKYELLCEEVIQKFELLEIKCKDDISNYLQSINDSMNIFYHQAIKYFPESDSYKYK